MVNIVRSEKSLNSLNLDNFKQLLVDFTRQILWFIKPDLLDNPAIINPTKNWTRVDIGRRVHKTSGNGQVITCPLMNPLASIRRFLFSSWLSHGNASAESRKLI